MGSYTQKLLRVTFVLSNNAIFSGNTPAGQTPANQLQLIGLRCGAVIKAQGAPAFPTAEFAIYGMAPSDMKALSALTFEVTGVTRNNIQVEASTNGAAGPWSTVYNGQIVSAFIDYSATPEVPLRVSAQMGFYDQINPATPTSYTGSTPVATIISSIAAKMGMAFENNGVSVVLSGPQYFPGVLTEQLRDAVAHAGIDQYMEAGASVQTIAICPKGAARNTPSFTLTPRNGLVSYPRVDSRGYLNIKSLYNPAFRFGGNLTIQGSDVMIDPNAPKTLNSQADGKWLIGQMTHSLDALKFDPQWFTDMLLYPPGMEPPQQ